MYKAMPPRLASTAQSQPQKRSLVTPRVGSPPGKSTRQLGGVLKEQEKDWFRVLEKMKCKPAGWRTWRFFLCAVLSWAERALRGLG